ncbi:hypothetical protein Q9966_016662 [Columba livia]|nr:hypothetical protein Q9966_016662 [Columba livia]KAK2511322.1 hypothetical protein Q9966_016662 [Columba livia]
MTTALTQGLERIPDQLGYLVISDGAVLASSGELENDERSAAVLSRAGGDGLRAAAAAGARTAVQAALGGFRGTLAARHGLRAEIVRGQAAEPEPRARECVRIGGGGGDTPNDSRGDPK